jgi:hypothetical protein
MGEGRQALGALQANDISNMDAFLSMPPIVIEERFNHDKAKDGTFLLTALSRVYKSRIIHFLQLVHRLQRDALNKIFGEEDWERVMYETFAAHLLTLNKSATPNEINIQEQSQPNAISSSWTIGA